MHVSGLMRAPKERHVRQDFSTELVNNSEGQAPVTNPLCRHYKGFIEMP